MSAYETWVASIAVMARAEADYRASASSSRNPPPTWERMAEPERARLRMDAARWANALVDAGILSNDGRTYRECPACREVIYDGRWIDADATEQLRTAHRVACTMKPGGSTL